MAIIILAVIVLAIKFLVRRRRPEGEWGAFYRNTDPHSFPSGHAAVAAAPTLLAAIYLGRRLLALGLGLAAIVLFGRMYVGAHLPLDLVGGFALGVVVASATDLILSMPRTAR